MIRKPREATDLMMWIGSSYYPKIEDFVDEAERMGVSKRVAHPPVNIKLGRSLLFLVHDEGHRENCKTCRGTGAKGGKLKVRLWVKNGKGSSSLDRKTEVNELVVKSKRAFQQLNKTAAKKTRRKKTWRPVKNQAKCAKCSGLGRVSMGGIFGFSRIDRVELLFDRASAAKEYRDRQTAFGRGRSVDITTVVSQDLNEVRRGCGYRQIGAYYLISDDLDILQDFEMLSEQLGVHWRLRGPIVVFDKPVPYTGHRFRGTKAVSRTEIFNQLRKKDKRGRRSKRRSPKRTRQARSR